jgi:hypothetical protein
LKGANDILHDLAAGVWPGAAIAMWIARGSVQTLLSAEELNTVLRAWSGLFGFLLLVLVVQLVTGTFRLSYWNKVVIPEQVKPKGRVTWAKHGVFVASLIASATVVFMALQP